eukprot:gnl/TRDRNA2_/TRDRNA2_167846_c0_seq1.p1 gnl/TRDRNA2_/TRDRNA2_167846_c0~~gnl/TRDRNA2_/TRDRNA2_167846_c0_seq1.p1  ORF type:complete len:249 (+),score=26.65 gnl/TRDRNA2_/TRDRNA2_167846_c0_seq1:79-825(+)
MRYRVCFLAAFHTVPAFACWMSSTECVDDAVALLQLRRQDDVVKELAAVIGKRQADHEEESLQEASSHVIENLKSLDLVSKLKARRMSYGAVLEKVISEALHAARKAMAPLDKKQPSEDHAATRNDMTHVSDQSAENKEETKEQQALQGLQEQSPSPPAAWNACTVSNPTDTALVTQVSHVFMHRIAQTLGQVVAAQVNTHRTHLWTTCVTNAGNSGSCTDINACNLRYGRAPGVDACATTTTAAPQR